MTSAADRDYFRRVGETLGQYDVGRPPESLAAAIEAVEELLDLAIALGHAVPDEAAQADESRSHLALYERHRALQASR